MKQTLTKAFIQKVCQLVDYLASRWQDEEEYEYISEYSIALTNQLKVSDVKIIKHGKIWKRVEFKHSNGNLYRVVIETDKLHIVRLF